MLLLLCCLLILSSGALCLNELKCMKGKHHKAKPGPESELYLQCAPWRENACCTANTSEAAHEDNSNLYYFNWNHCGAMSSKCKKHFIQDMCFYECSPDLGPWIQPAGENWRKERILNVPLCKEDCERWWKDCKEDFTCKTNWHKGWDWSSGSYCRKWTDVYATPKSMCEQIWSNSYRYTNLTKNSGRCMELRFTVSNHTKVVEYHPSTAQRGQSFPVTTLLFLTATFFFVTIF